MYVRLKFNNFQIFQHNSIPILMHTKLFLEIKDLVKQPTFMAFFSFLKNSNYHVMVIFILTVTLKIFLDIFFKHFIGESRIQIFWLKLFWKILPRKIAFLIIVWFILRRILDRRGQASPSYPQTFMSTRVFRKLFLSINRFWHMWNMFLSCSIFWISNLNQQFSVPGVHFMKTETVVPVQGRRRIVLN